MPDERLILRTATARRAVGLLLWALLGFGPPVLGQPPDGEEDEIDLERTVTIEARLLGVERVPMPGSIAIARFSVVGGGYDGSMLSLAYDYTRPVRLRSWDVHDASGFHRTGGARVTEPAVGQWDDLLRPDSHEPVHTLVLTMIQHDLNEDEKRRRWHFKTIESIEPRFPRPPENREGPPRREIPPDR